MKIYNGSYYVNIHLRRRWSFYHVPQGSITVNGISLTVAESKDNQFSVAIIPYTWELTNMNNLKVGDHVNLEFGYYWKICCQTYLRDKKWHLADIEAIALRTKVFIGFMVVCFQYHRFYSYAYLIIKKSTDDQSVTEMQNKFEALMKTLRITQ